MTTKHYKLSFSAATVNDVAALRDLEASYYPNDGYPSPFFFQALHQWPDLVQVARVITPTDNTIVGYCLGAPGQDPHQVWLMSLLVDKRQRGMGIGKQLLQNWLAHLERLNDYTIFLSVAPANAAAIKLYQSCGFDITSTQHDYLGKGEDRHLMCRTRTSKH